MRSLMTFGMAFALVFAAAGCGTGGDPLEPGGADLELRGVQPGAGLNTAVEEALLTMINGRRSGDGMGLLERDPGHDYLIQVYTDGLAVDQTLGGRQAEELAQEHTGWDRLLCAEITQWWGGAPSAQVHFDALMGAGAAGQLTDANDRFCGLSVAEGKGPSGSQFEDRDGSYLGVLICNHPFRLITDPAAD